MLEGRHRRDSIDGVSCGRQVPCVAPDELDGIDGDDSGASGAAAAIELRVEARVEVGRVHPRRAVTCKEIRPDAVLTTADVDDAGTGCDVHRVEEEPILPAEPVVQPTHSFGPPDPKVRPPELEQRRFEVAEWRGARLSVGDHARGRAGWEGRCHLAVVPGLGICNKPPTPAPVGSPRARRDPRRRPGRRHRDPRLSRWESVRVSGVGAR